MRISDWSSDVCSSDLLHGAHAEQRRRAPRSRQRRRGFGADRARRPAAPGGMPAMTPASRQRTLQIAPALLIIGFFTAAPHGLMAYFSLLENGAHGVVLWDPPKAAAHAKVKHTRDTAT